MLDKQTVENIKKTIKDINKEKKYEDRLNQMIESKEKIRFVINEELDDLFAEVELETPKKVSNNYEELQ